jgi:adenine deaminase
MRGAIAPGYLADLVVVRDLSSFTISEVYKHGRPVKEPCQNCNNQPGHAAPPATSLHIDWAKVDFRLPARSGENLIRVIGCVEHQIVTTAEQAVARVEDGFLVADPRRDLLKIAVIERHHASGNMGRGFVRGFGLKNGAIASTIAHDSHNLLVVGTDDAHMERAARMLDRAGGGIALVSPESELVLSLPIGGLMSDEQPEQIAAAVAGINTAAASAGIVIHNPFMLLSFLALPVIPSLKITDQGLIDVESFATVSLWL